MPKLIKMSSWLHLCYAMCWSNGDVFIGCGTKVIIFTGDAAMDGEHVEFFRQVGDHVYDLLTGHKKDHVLFELVP